MFGYCVGVLKSLALASRPVLGDLPIHLTLSSSSNHVVCMIINCSLHGYIRTCRLHVGIFFYSLFSFYLEVGLDVCPLSMKYHFYPCHALWFTMQVCNHVYAHARLLYLALLWENINNDTLNTFGWNATMIDPCTCEYFSVIVNNYHSWCFLVASLSLTQS